jgi:hypothetical protein
MPLKFRSEKNLSFDYGNFRRTTSLAAAAPRRIRRSPRDQGAEVVPLPTSTHQHSHRETIAPVLHSRSAGLNTLRTQAQRLRVSSKFGLMRCGGLTLDMSGDQRTQLFGCPLHGGVKSHSAGRHWPRKPSNQPLPRQHPKQSAPD